MAVNIRSASAVPLKWGTITTSGYIVEGNEVDHSGEVTELTNENGDIVTTISNYGKKERVTLSVIPLTATEPPTPGALFEYGDDALKINVESVQRSQSKGSLEKWTITGSRYEEIAAYDAG